MSSAAVPALAPGRTISLSRLSEEQLAVLVARGSEPAFAELYARYHQQLYRYCRSIVLHDADAQDALQSTFAAALSALRQDKRNAPLRPWLYRISHNEAISLIRRRRDAAEGAAAELVEQAVSVEEHAAQRARLATLVADLQALPERLRGALVMRELSGLSHEEIAIALGTSVGAAKQAIFDARCALLELEEGRAMPCEDVRRAISDGDGRVLRGRRLQSHLRGCAGCAAFADAIPARRAELRALVPLLPPAASVALLSRAMHGLPAHAAAPAGGATTGAAVSATGKTIAAALASKAAVGAAVVVTAAAGVGGVTLALHAAHHRGNAASPANGARSAGSASSAGARGAAGNTGRSSAGSSGSTAAGLLSSSGTSGAAGATSATGTTTGSSRGGNSGTHPGRSASAPGRSGNAGHGSHQPGPPSAHRPHGTGVNPHGKRGNPPHRKSHQAGGSGGVLNVHKPSLTGKPLIKKHLQPPASGVVSLRGRSAR